MHQIQMPETERERRGLQLSLFGPVPSREDPVINALLRKISDLDSYDFASYQSGDRPWTKRELEAWLPPDNSLVSDFAAQDRYLVSDFSAFQGQWEHRAYYAIEPMDAFIDPILEELTLMAAAQSVKTEIVHNQLGYAIKNDPAPALLVMPSLKSTKIVNERIKQMILASPALIKHLTGKEDDLSLNKIKLDNMSIYFATAGSDADLRNVFARYIILDEQDGYPASTEKGKQGSPIGQAKARAITVWNRKFLNLSTPTLESGNINKSYQKSDMRRYWMPCPHCLGYQILTFWRLKHVGCRLGEWPKDARDEDYIISNSVSRYECIHCGREIEHRYKSWMDQMGTWVPECKISERAERCVDCLQRDVKPEGPSASYCPKITRDGSVAIPRLRSRHRGYQWSAMISPFVTWDTMAAEFFKSKDDPETYKDFVQLYLGEIWREATIKREADEILELRTERPALNVPPGTIALTSGVDNQKHGKWVVIRAWIRDGRAIESHLIRHGFVETWDELDQWIFEYVYTIEDSGIVLPIWRGGIDIGGSDTDDFSDETMTEEVYDWLRRKGRGVMFGVKGMSRQIGGGKKMRSSIIDRMPSRKGKIGKPIPGGLKLWLLDTALIKNAIWSRIESGKFHLHADADSTYAKHMTAERKEKTSQGKTIWIAKGRHANHLFDAEVYAAAMADPECDGGVMVLKDPAARFSQAQQRPRVIQSKWMGGGQGD
jgi:phage terminase large subunit GpA-like protein